MRAQDAAAPHAGWRDWYDYFPWEDHRAGAPRAIGEALAPSLRAWADSAPEAATRQTRWRRAAIAFGLEGGRWNEELVLQRYELLFEASLVPEAHREARTSAHEAAGRAMNGDHRRILATGIAWLRAKIKYNPVVFELMPATFTLSQLQRCVEALAGLLVHKPNFRRLIEQQAGGGPSRGDHRSRRRRASATRGRKDDRAMSAGLHTLDGRARDRRHRRRSHFGGLADAQRADSGYRAGLSGVGARGRRAPTPSSFSRRAVRRGPVDKRLHLARAVGRPVDMA
jgi:hypothetical protein